MSDAPVLDGLHEATDLAAAGDFERKHTPVIAWERNGESVSVRVGVGEVVSHPNLPDHWIRSIELAVSGATIARFDIEPVAVAPVLTCTVHLEPGTELVARASCNLHGVWISRVTLA